MPLMLAGSGHEVCIKRIGGNDETKRFLNSLGFVVGTTVTVVSELGGNVIINIKGSRVALDKSMASRIMV
ncbi:FeoA family protein [uncultured Clostridium sp.]|uniref:FeoA family protein n=1 Tax=uncultured Clostridium sp. TaxID=59620 RepID=UPI002600CE98|nr:FeoA family protein [uncultured Clostridium sp.]